MKFKIGDKVKIPNRKTMGSSSYILGDIESCKIIGQKHMYITAIWESSKGTHCSLHVDKNNMGKHNYYNISDIDPFIQSWRQRLQ